uniref:Polyprotein n=1 Tax=Mycena chlorophos TaxID=658473 RepID=A0ABQ0KWA0_MYCCL|nr:polyprotein [Mycena chlorophos]
MGHLPIDAAKKLVKNQLVEGIELDESKPTSSGTCPSCLHGRMTRTPMSKAAERDADGKLGDQVHSDVWGPSSVQTPQHKRYYVTFTDDASRYTVAMLLATKDQTFEAFKELDARWHKLGVDIKILHSDNGGEYKSQIFDEYLAQRGIQRRLTVHDTPEHNGVAERLNRTLLEKVRTMLHGSALPKTLWGEALKHAVWLKNRTLTKAVGGKTPYEVFTGKKPDLRDLHEWGCKLFVHVEGSKLDGRARSGRWVGYDQESNGHRVYFPDNGAIRVELRVKFEQTPQRTAGIAERTLTLTQSTYIDALIEKFGMTNTKPLSVPLDPNHQLSIDQCPTSDIEKQDMKKVPYRELIGGLVWLWTATRPDLAFSVTILSRFVSNPGRPHWDAAKRVLQYLKGTRTLGLTYGGSAEQLGLNIFADADGMSIEDRKAVSGYVFTLNGGSVSWSSKQQAITALSTTEAEYISLTHCAKEALWFRKFISELFGPITTPLIIYTDNQSAMALAQAELGQFHARTKHIDVRYHFIRDHIQSGTLQLVYCPTAEMLADILTKALPPFKLKPLRDGLGLISA